MHDLSNSKSDDNHKSLVKVISPTGNISNASKNTANITYKATKVIR